MSVAEGTVTHVYSADVATVFAMLTDAKFLRQRGEATGETDIDISVDDQTSVRVIRYTRSVRRELPSFAKRLFKATNVVRQVETWRGDDNKTGSWDIEVDGAPIKIHAKLSLRPHERGSEYRIEYAVRAKVPLIGKRLAAYTLKQTIEGFRAELGHNDAELEKRIA